MGSLRWAVKFWNEEGRSLNPQKKCKNIATGETSQAITPFHFIDYFHFFYYFDFFEYFHFFGEFHFFD